MKKPVVYVLCADKTTPLTTGESRAALKEQVDAHQYYPLLAASPALKMILEHTPCYSVDAMLELLAARLNARSTVTRKKLTGAELSDILFAIRQSIQLEEED